MNIPSLSYNWLIVLEFYKWRCEDHVFQNDNGIFFGQKRIGNR